MNPLLSGLLRAVLFGAGTVATLMPRRLELTLGPLLGRLALRLDRKRSRIARDNIRLCLPALDDAAAAALLRSNYEHYGTLALELLHLFSPLPGHYCRYARRVMRLHGYEHWKRAQGGGKGVIFVSSHLGNWEMLAAAGGLNGMEPTMVTRRTKPEWLRAKLRSARAELGVREVYDPRTLPAVLKALRRGESVGFVIDQYAAPPSGIPVRFFGVEVDTLSAVGPLAGRTGAAVVPATSRRQADGLVHVTIEPAMELGPALSDPAATTQALAAKVEQWIRETPEQWLWVHRRFKNLRAPVQTD